MDYVLSLSKERSARCSLFAERSKSGDSHSFGSAYKEGYRALAVYGCREDIQRSCMAESNRPPSAGMSENKKKQKKLLDVYTKRRYMT